LQTATHSQLMVHSWWRIEAVAQRGSAEQQQFIKRLLEQPARWRLWETQHSQLMDCVASRRQPTKQLREMRRTTFGLIHRKALFEYLRKDQEARRNCRRLMQLFRAHTTRTAAIVAEHENFLRLTCSDICSRHLGAQLMDDGYFRDPLVQYESAYDEYFRSFCRCALADPDNQSLDAERALLPYLKFELNRHRLQIMNAPRMSMEMLRDLRIRERTGDTLEIKTLAGNPRAMR